MVCEKKGLYDMYGYERVCNMLEEKEKENHNEEKESTNTRDRNEVIHNNEKPSFFYLSCATKQKDLKS